MAERFDNDDESWVVNRKLVSAELKRIADDVHGLRLALDQIRHNDISDFRTEIALLKFKCALWGMVVGGLSGAIVTTAAILLRLVH